MGPEGPQGDPGPIGPQGIPGEDGAASIPDPLTVNTLTVNLTSTLTGKVGIGGAPDAGPAHLKVYNYAQLPNTGIGGGPDGGYELVNHGKSWLVGDVGCGGPPVAGQDLYIYGASQLQGVVGIQGSNTYGVSLVNHGTSWLHGGVGLGQAPTGGVGTLSAAAGITCATVQTTGDVNVGTDAAKGNLYTTFPIYPGRADTSWTKQSSWYLGSHGLYGLYTNTGLRLEGGISAVGNLTGAAVTCTTINTQNNNITMGTGDLSCESITATGNVSADAFLAAAITNVTLTAANQTVTLTTGTSLLRVNGGTGGWSIRTINTASGQGHILYLASVGGAAWVLATGGNIAAGTGSLSPGQGVILIWDSTIWRLFT